MEHVSAWIAPAVDWIRENMPIVTFAAGWAGGGVWVFRLVQSAVGSENVYPNKVVGRGSDGKVESRPSNSTSSRYEFSSISTIVIAALSGPILAPVAAWMNRKWTRGRTVWTIKLWVDARRRIAQSPWGWLRLRRLLERPLPALRGPASDSLRAVGVDSVGDWRDQSGKPRLSDALDEIGLSNRSEKLWLSFESSCLVETYNDTMGKRVQVLIRKYHLAGVECERYLYWVDPPAGVDHWKSALLADDLGYADGRQP